MKLHKPKTKTTTTTNMYCRVGCKICTYFAETSEKFHDCGGLFQVMPPPAFLLFKFTIIKVFFLENRFKKHWCVGECSGSLTSLPKRSAEPDFSFNFCDLKRNISPVGPKIMKSFWVCSAMFLKTSLPFPQQCSKENTCPCFPGLLNSHSSQPPFPEFSPQAVHSPHSSSHLLLFPPKLSGSHPLDARLSLEVRASCLVLSCPYFLHGDTFHFVLLEGPFSSAHLTFFQKGRESSKW